MIRRAQLIGKRVRSNRTPARAGALPTFLVGGTLRGGTSSLFRFLADRADIGMSRQKEPHFFSFRGADLSRHGPYEDPSDIITDEAAYEALFADCATKSHPTALPGKREDVHATVNRSACRQ